MRHRDPRIGRRELLRSAAALGIAGAFTAPAHASTFPTGPITIVVPFAPGGQADTLTRVVANEMSAILGQPVVVDNRSGAGGAIGTAYVAQAKPDGYTVAYSSSGTMVVLPATNPKLGYDADKDLAPVGQMFEIPMMLVARKDFGPGNIKELVAAAKAAPGKHSIGNTGVGALAHLVSEYFQNTVGIQLLHVPYRGDGPMLQGLIGGELDLGSVSVSAGAGHVQAGTIKVLALLGPERYAPMPDVQTVAEAGYPGFAAGTFGGLHVPAATPKAVVERLSSAMSAAISKTEVSERILKSACLPVGSAPADYGKRIAAERELWGGVIKRLGIKLD